MTDARVTAFHAYIDEQAKRPGSSDAKSCRQCNGASPVLVDDPVSDDRRRTICPKCQGQINRRRLEPTSTRQGTADDDDWYGSGR